MPGSIQSMTPTAVFPETLSRAFTESQTWAAIVNEYHDGMSQRGAKVEAPRHSWRLTKRLPPAGIVTLWQFVELHIVDTFYFYNPKETLPPNTTDPTGAATAGRYAVRINSDWSQSTGIALTDAVVELIEVTPMSLLAFADVWITLTAAKGLTGAEADLAPPLAVLLASNEYAFRCRGAIAKSKLGSTGALDALYLPAGASAWVSIFPGISGITIDDGIVVDFAEDPLDIPHLADLRLDCLSLSAVADDELTLQVRGEIVRA